MIDSTSLLPNYWHLIPLEEVCKSVRGVTFASGDTQEESFDNSIACVTTSGVQDEVAWETRRFVSRDKVKTIQILQVGDILVSTANSKALVGKSSLVYSIPFDCTFGAFVTVLRPNQDLIDPFYLAKWLRTPTALQYFYSMSSETVNISNLRVSDLLALKIPLPPPLEQQRIVAVLKQADDLRRSRRAANEKAEGLVQALFYEMFGEPNSWHDERSLGDFVDFVGGGTPSRRVEEYFTGDIPWATSKDMKSRYLSDAEEHITEEAIRNSATNLVPAGTILIVVKSKILAHTLPIAVTTRPFCFGQDLKGMICRPGVAPEFIVAAILAQADSVLAKARGVNTEGLTLEILRSIAIPPITPDQQNLFVEKVHEHDLLELRQTAASEKIETLFDSLLAQAFTGELTQRWREQHRADLVRQSEEMRVKLALRRAPSGIDAIMVRDDGQVTLIQAKFTGARRKLTDFIREVITDQQFPRYWTLLDIANALRINQIPRAALREAVEMLVVTGDVRPVGIPYNPIGSELQVIQAFTRVTQEDLVGADEIRL